jgi:hypothetical protein
LQRDYYISFQPLFSRLTAKPKSMAYYTILPAASWYNEAETKSSSEVYQRENKGRSAADRRGAEAIVSRRSVFPAIREGL